MRKFPFRFDLPFGNCQTTPAPSINHRRETCVQVKTQIIFPTTLANTNIITVVVRHRRFEWNGWWHTFQNENSRTTGLVFPLDFSAVWKDTHTGSKGGGGVKFFPNTIRTLSAVEKWSFLLVARKFEFRQTLLYYYYFIIVRSGEYQHYFIRCANHVLGQRYFELENYATLRLTISTNLFSR